MAFDLGIESPVENNPLKEIYVGQPSHMTIPPSKGSTRIINLEVKQNTNIYYPRKSIMGPWKRVPN
jgi:hypothetical protein